MTIWWLHAAITAQVFSQMAPPPSSILPRALSIYQMGLGKSSTPTPNPRPTALLLEACLSVSHARAHHHDIACSASKEVAGKRSER